jgi:hypothetical protein
MTASKISPPPTPGTSKSSLPETLRYCLHRDERGEHDCGIAFLSPYPNRLCPAHRQKAVL